MKKEEKIKKKRFERRLKRTRNKIVGTRTMRVSVFRSNKHFYAQLIDDARGQTILSIHENEVENSGTKTQRARELGKLFAAKAVSKKIKQVVFDKGAYKYHGRVKAFADAAREGGLEF